MESLGQFGRAPGGDLLRNTLQQIPTIFGRLVYLSSLRNHSSGHYEHELLARVFGNEDADHALRNKHRQIFSEWLERSLDEQKNDLLEYLGGFSTAAEPAAEVERSLPYRNLIPPAAREVERLLYLTDLETLFDLLRVERGLRVWRPGA